MIAPQNAETSAIQENYGKFREKIGEKSGKIQENSGKFGKIRENSGKFGKIRENSGKNRGRAGEEPGKSRGTENFAKKPKILPKKNRGMGQNLPKMQFYRILMWKLGARESNIHQLEGHHFESPFVPYLLVGKTRGFILAIRNQPAPCRDL